MLLKFIKILFISMLIILGSAIFAVYMFPNHTIRPVIEELCESQIPGQVSIDSVSLSWNGVILNRLSYLANKKSSAITLEKLKLKMELGGDSWISIKKIALYDLDIWASWSEKTGLNASGINLSELTEKQDSDSDLADFDFKIPIELNNIMVHLKTPDDLYNVNLSGEIDLQAREIKSNLDMKFQSKDIAMNANVVARGNMSALEFTADINDLTHNMLKAIKLNGSVIGGYKNDMLDAKLSFEGKDIKFNGSTSHDLLKDQSNLSLNFSLNNLGIAKEILDKMGYKANGKLSGDLIINQKGNKKTEKLVLNLGNIKLEHPKFVLNGVTGAIAFSSLDNFKTYKNQKINIKSAEGFVSANNIDVTMTHRGGGVFDIDGLSGDIDVGKFSSPPFSWDINRKNNSLILDIKGITAQYIINFLKVSDAVVSGHVDGRLPMTLSGDDFAIRGGNLYVRENSGSLRYRPDNSKGLDHNISQLTGQESPVDLALIALWNLHYTHLSVDLNKELGQDLAVTLHIKGRNPDAFSAQPFEFNINVSGETLRLIEETLKSIK